LFFDSPLNLWLHAHPHPVLIHFMLLITHWHSTLGVVLMTAAVGFALHRRGLHWWLLTLVVCVPGGLLLNVAVKHFVQRARPHVDHPLLTLTSYSFPSGHTAGATVFYGFMVALLLAHVKQPGRRIAIVGVAVAMVLLVGFSRMYLGVHYLTDVLAAIVEGVLWVLLTLATVDAWRRRRSGSFA
jgi:membrane-associated phospholipid phosphatase